MTEMAMAPERLCKRADGCWEGSAWLLCSGTVISSVRRQRNKCEVSKKVIGVEVRKMQIGEEYKIICEADGNLNSRPRKRLQTHCNIAYANRKRSLGCPLAFLFKIFLPFIDFFDNLVVLM